jgi:hypothetical protein
MILTEKTKGLGEKSVPVVLSTRNPTCTDIDVNLSLCCEKPVTNCLNYGMGYSV